MRSEIDEFVSYLKEERKVSENSMLAYMSDISEFSAMLTKRGTLMLADASEADVVSYVMSLKNDDKAESTIKRKLASIRALYAYLLKNKKISENPVSNIRTPKIEKKPIEYLTVEEISAIFDLSFEGVKGIRDKAMLELMYATGIRVRELVELRLGDINLKLGFITCTGEFGKARIIPLGKFARNALETYLSESRPHIVEEEEEDTLFLNRNGKKMTRQGVWKILKDYSERSELGDRLTPQTIRNSFAAHMIQNGADLKSLQELMGHEDATATQIFLSLTKNRIKDVYDRTHPRA